MKNANRNAPASAPDQVTPEQFRSYLLRYALLQLRDQTAAEDVVQETLLAAIEGSGRFTGKSSVKTWLTGILKHKIIDHLRRHGREQPLLGDGADSERSEAEAADALFASDGHWREAPANWGDPDRAFENRRFWEVFETCAKLMPARTARVFTMREVLGLPTEEICKELGITTTNCWVMLHRARLSLRACLELKWFGKS
ncbi:MAG TPA: sigma-70 family RNA polymerase sigma factor [Burkholderiales bacterium]|nr:sigma-70 family RNA polymerase sigma factor [Burkholderiales bacterium]